MAQAVQPSSDQVRSQLNRILESRDFRASESLSVFLRYVVDETLAGRDSIIKGYTIAVRAFGRDPDFDPQTDTFVRTHAHRLRRALERYYFTVGADDPIRINLQSGTYVPSFIFADNAPTRRPSSHEVERAPSGVVASISVAPFATVGPDCQTQVPAAILNEALVVALGHYPSVRQYDHAAACALPNGLPAYSIEGSITLHAAVAHITVKLIAQASGMVVWTQVFTLAFDTPELPDRLTALASQIAARIADDYGIIARANITTMLRQVQGKSTESSVARMETIDPTLAYLHASDVLTTGSYRRAKQALVNVLERRPHDAAAAVMLADLLCSMYMLRGASDKTLRRAENFVQRAQVLDPRDVRLGVVQMRLLRLQTAGDIPSVAEHARKRAVGNATLLGRIGTELAFAGAWDVGIELLSQATAQNPDLPGWVLYAPFLYYYRHAAFEEALAVASTFHTPCVFWDPLLRAALCGQLGDAPGAAQALHQLERRKSRLFDAPRALLHRLLQRPEDVDAVLDGLAKAEQLLSVQGGIRCSSSTISRNSLHVSVPW